jgi:hypothetical protein
MKNKKLFLFIAIIFMVMFSNNSFGQFEQKFTIQASGGLVKPLGVIGDSLSAGLSLDAGVQYNYSRSLAFVGLIKFVILYPQVENANSELGSIGISICPKYRFFPDSKVNPFVLGGVGLFFTKYSVFDSGEWIDYKFPTSFGYTVGAGVDVSINDNIALFFQSGYSSSILKDKDFIVNFNSLYFQVGINFSFLKSKSL